MSGIEALENFIDDKVKELEVVSEVVDGSCFPGRLCSPEAYFEMIEMCRLCGKLC